MLAGFPHVYTKSSQILFAHMIVLLGVQLIRSSRRQANSRVVFMDMIGDVGTVRCVGIVPTDSRWSFRTAFFERRKLN